VKKIVFGPIREPAAMRVFSFRNGSKKIWEYGSIFKKMRGEGVGWDWV